MLTPRRNGAARLFSHDDRERLALILQGKRLGFTLTELREMLAARVRGCNNTLPIDRRKCVEQINMLERQRRDIDGALAKLRQIYTEMFVCLRFFCGIQGHGLGKDVIAITISGVPYPLT
ncbi:MAG TPA: MerR family DNA-binding protein [Pseudolabrys sp.]